MGFTRKDILKFAFEEAVANLPVNAFDSDLTTEILKTGMRAYSDREHQNFTADEIAETVKKGIADAKKASDDFLLQDWAMKR